MKYLVIALFLSSTTVEAKNSYCSSNAGKFITLMQTNEILPGDTVLEIREKLYDKCQDMESKKTPIEEVAKELSNSCNDLVSAKVKGAEKFAKYRAACAVGTIASEAYIEGIKYGQEGCSKPGSPDQGPPASAAKPSR